MYDPEFGMILEDNIKYFYEVAVEEALRLGDSHPWAQRMMFVAKVYEDVASYEREYMDCYDDLEKQRLKDKIKELHDIMREAFR